MKLVCNNYTNKLFLKNFYNFIRKKKKTILVITTIIFLLFICIFIKDNKVEKTIEKKREKCDDNCYKLDNVFPKVNYSARARNNFKDSKYCPEVPKSLSKLL